MRKIAVPGKIAQCGAKSRLREGEARRDLETAIARRKETFALSHLAWAADGYTVKFRLGVVEIVRTAVDVFKDLSAARMDRMKFASTSLSLSPIFTAGLRLVG